MVRYLKIFFVVAVGLICVQAATAQTYDLQFVVVNNDGVHFDVKVQVKSNGSAYGMGLSNMVFDFNTADLGSPTLLTAHNFSGGGYGTMTVTNPVTQTVSINIELTSSPVTNVLTSYTDVVTVRFNVLDVAGNANLVWRTDGSLQMFDDAFTEYTPGTLNNLNTSPLPIQLASFTAAPQPGNAGVILKWSTISETENLGFNVQKRLDSSKVYETIVNSFIEGHGTSEETHAYTFTDTDVKPGVWYYRLMQTDLDGTIHYSESILAGTLTGVKERPLPTTFALDQNYPNPFNPSTTIEFALPKDARVNLDVYNVLGQRVATLVDEIRTAGYHSVRFNAGQMASGLYIYRIVAGDVTMVKKMMLTK